MIFWGCQRNSW